MLERGPTKYVRALEQIVRSTPWLLEVLAAVRKCELPQAHLAAGAVRNTVWDVLHGRASPGASSDLDVVYFDTGDVPNSTEERLGTILPQFCWEVTNQATVHRWQSVDAGRAIEPYASLAAALSSWPETATAVAARLTDAGGLEFVAPFGLTDLFELRVRPNPKASNPVAYEVRRAQKQWQARWPKLCVL